MGNFYSACRDPMFYCHHMNVDRLWYVCKHILKRNRDPKKPEFHEASFLFYDENGGAVSVKVKDCLDTSILGYSYETVDLPWMEKRPTPTVPRKSPKQRKIIKDPKFPVTLSSAVSTTIKRPKTSRTAKETENEEVVIMVAGIELDYNIRMLSV